MQKYYLLILILKINNIYKKKKIKNMYLTWIFKIM